MKLKYNSDQREEYLSMTERIGLAWIKVFEGNTEFYSAAYWDLLTGIWKAKGAVKKTDALRLMKAIKSAHTAGKYVEAAIQHGIVVESENPADARSKLMALSPDMMGRMDAFFDAAVGELRAANHRIDVKGPSPEEP